jgi:hypothetical protein
MFRKLSLFVLLAGLLIITTACQAGSPTATSIPIIETEEEMTEPTATAPDPEPSSTATLAPTPTLEPSPTPRSILRQDDFSDVNSGWERYRQFDGILDYVVEEETYQMKVFAEDSLWYVWIEEDQSNVKFSVETWLVEGPEDTLYGLMCRFDDDHWNSVVFLINTQGQAGVGLLVNNFQPLPGGELTHFKAIHTGLNAKNTIEAGCVGESLTMIVNGERLFDIAPPDFTGEDIGLAVRTPAGSSAEVRFDNLILYAP